tara:strand:- start:8304 stop:8624 length:321 start_codon:yes stop_codon:yes gene_type:complete
MSIPHIHKDTITIGEDLTLTSDTIGLDMVDNPPHYNNASIECIDAMEAMTKGSDISGHSAYCWQTAFKYLWRWPYKEKALQDLYKCRWYIDRLISILEKDSKYNDN